MKHILNNDFYYRNILLIVVMLIVYKFASNYMIVNAIEHYKIVITLTLMATYVSILFFGVIFSEIIEAIQYKNNGVFPIHIRWVLTKHWMFYLIMIISLSYRKVVNKLYEEFFEINND